MGHAGPVVVASAFGSYDWWPGIDTLERKPAELVLNVVLQCGPLENGFRQMESTQP
jgi:hypothetical protein